MRDWVPKSFDQKVCALNSFNASLAPAWVENCFGGLELVCEELHGLSRPFLGLVSVDLLPFPPSPISGLFVWGVCFGVFQESERAPCNLHISLRLQEVLLFSEAPKHVCAVAQASMEPQKGPSEDFCPF